MVGAGAWGAGTVEALFNVYRLLVFQDEKSSRSRLHKNVSVHHTSNLRM